MEPPSIWLGFDPREAAAFAVARGSARHHLTLPVPIRGLVLQQLRLQGLYTRPTMAKGGGKKPLVLWDSISGAPMSTEFAISRFLVPFLCGYRGWALFMDSDILVRGNLARLFELADASKAVQVVQHHHVPTKGAKMDGQPQLAYPRKNWSSVMLFNCAHPSNLKLSPDLVNQAPGRDLHRFCWLDDSEVGELPLQWNWLVGHSPPVPDAKVVHFTDGFPQMAGYEYGPYSDEWREALARWAVA